MAIKLFVGTKSTGELKVPCELQKIPHDGKEYIGLSIERDSICIDELHKITTSLRSLLQRDHPDLRCDNLVIVVFPRLFCG